MSTSMEKAIAIGGSVGGAGALGFISGVAATTTGTLFLTPCGIFLGGGIVIGSGLGALSKIIFN